MKKFLTSIIIMMILIFVAFEIVSESSLIMETESFSFNIWKNNIFPSLFPFFVLSEILINYGFIEFIGELGKPIMNTLFKMNGSCAYIFVMSMISGFPSNAKYTKELYNQGLINENEAAKVLTFTHFSNPLFIIGTVSMLFLNNKEVGLLIIICHYLGNIIVGVLFRNYYPSKKENNKFSLKNAVIKMNNRRLNNKGTFGEILSKSLVNSINTLLLILGIITIFLIITTIIDHNINLNSYYQSILNGIFEMTQGLKYISILDIPLKLKVTLSVMILSFGGLSVHMQIISILSGTKIKYFPFLVARIIHATISSIMVYFLFDIWIKLI